MGGDPSVYNMLGLLEGIDELQIPVFIFPSPADGRSVWLVSDVRDVLISEDYIQAHPWVPGNRTLNDIMTEPRRRQQQDYVEQMVRMHITDHGLLFMHGDEGEGWVAYDPDIFHGRRQTPTPPAPTLTRETLPIVEEDESDLPPVLPQPPLNRQQ